MHHITECQKIEEERNRYRDALKEIATGRSLDDPNYLSDMDMQLVAEIALDGKR